MGGLLFALVFSIVFAGLQIGDLLCFYREPLKVEGYIEYVERAVHYRGHGAAIDKGVDVHMNGEVYTIHRDRSMQRDFGFEGLMDDLGLMLSNQIGNMAQIAYMDLPIGGKVVVGIQIDHAYLDTEEAIEDNIAYEFQELKIALAFPAISALGLALTLYYRRKSPK